MHAYHLTDHVTRDVKHKVKFETSQKTLSELKFGLKYDLDPCVIYKSTVFHI